MKTFKVRAVGCFLLALGLGFLMVEAASATPPVVDAYSRFKNGPFFLLSTASHNPFPNGTVQDIVHLDVTPGLYVIFAKGFAVDHSGFGGTVVDCKLIAGVDSDHVQVGVDARDDLRTDREPFSLNVLHNFTTAGTIVLRCSCDADDADLSSLKVTAMRVNSYWNLSE
jgi:hypothetical protein